MKLRTKAGLAAAASLSLLAPALAAAPAGAAAASAHGHYRTEPSKGDWGRVLDVVATFTGITPADRQQFLTAAQKEAYLSLKTQPGTLSYHVVPDPNDPSTVWFIASFTDEAAFVYHHAAAPARALLKLAAADHINGPNIVVNAMTVPNTDGEHVAPSRGDAGTVLVVVASFTDLTPADRQQFLTASQLEGYLALVQQPETISYHITPDPTDPSVVWFEATFTDEPAFVFHHAAPPAVTLLNLVAADHIGGPNIVINSMAVPNAIG